MYESKLFLMNTKYNGHSPLARESVRPNTGIGVIGSRQSGFRENDSRQQECLPWNSTIRTNISQTHRLQQVRKRQSQRLHSPA